MENTITVLYDGIKYLVPEFNVFAFSIKQCCRTSSPMYHSTWATIKPDRRRRSRDMWLPLPLEKIKSRLICWSEGRVLT